MRILCNKRFPHGHRTRASSVRQRYALLSLFCPLSACYAHSKVKMAHRQSGKSWMTLHFFLPLAASDISQWHPTFCGAFSDNFLRIVLWRGYSGWKNDCLDDLMKLSLLAGIELPSPLRLFGRSMHKSHEQSLAIKLSADHKLEMLDGVPKAILATATATASYVDLDIDHTPDPSSFPKAAGPR